MPQPPYPDPPIWTGNIWQVTVCWNCNGALSENILYLGWKSTDPAYSAAPPSQDELLAAWWGSGLGESWCAILPISVNVEFLAIQRIAPDRNVRYRVTPIANNLGTLSSTTSTGGPVAVCQTLRTNTFGRRGRGRLFLGNIPTAWLTGGKITLTSTARSLIDTMGDALQLATIRDGEGLIEASPVVFSKAASTYNITTHGYSTAKAGVITSVDSDFIVRTQRRREFGVGM